jgi:hypothetical protein
MSEITYEAWLRTDALHTCSCRCPEWIHVAGGECANCGKDRLMSPRPKCLRYNGTPRPEMVEARA